jgi:alpha-amylase
MVMRHPETSFKTATETVKSYETTGEYDVPDVLTWADTDRDLTAWTGNDIQRDAIAAIYGMEKDVMSTRKRDLIETWRKLQTSDHFYYMCTKWSNDGDVHAYFSPYQSPYDAYIAFMNALSDLQLRVKHVLTEKEAREKAKLAKEGADDVDDVEEIVEEEEDLGSDEMSNEDEVDEVSEPSPRRWWEKIIDALPFFKSPRREGISS